MPNKTGTVFVLMFHHVGDRKNPNFCTAKQFVDWLTKLDELGFRPVTAKEYLTNTMDLPPGASPVVLTFDDANPDQLQLDDKGNVTPDCFVGLWMKFAKSHPEFPVKATFFVLPVFFGQKQYEKQKFDLLTRLGCEIANHTMTHPDLGRLNDSQVEEEIGQAQIRLEKMGVKAPIPLAVPYGVRPRNHKLLTGFTYGKEEIKPLGVFMAGASPAFAPTSKHMDRYHIPRIIANANDSLGLDYWLKRVESGKEELYVEGPAPKKVPGKTPGHGAKKGAVAAPDPTPPAGQPSSGQSTSTSSSPGAQGQGTAGTGQAGSGSSAAGSSTTSGT